MELKRILVELVFFLVLVSISEICRLVAKRRCAGKSVLQGLLVCSLVLLWYTVSITLILFNKWIMVKWRDDGLPFPIFYTMNHMILKGVFSSSYLKCVRCQRLPRVKRKVFLGASFVGVMTGLDVAASNLSFLYISVSFFTMLKSASLIFILVLATLARIEKCSWSIAGTISTITTGAFIMTYGEVHFHLVGFSLVMSSEVAASMRWIATQVLVQDKSLDSMCAVLYMSPASTLSLVPLVIARERDKLKVLRDPWVAIEYSTLVLFPGFLAFLLLLVEVQLVKETSSLTLSVFGNLKSIVTILLSIIVFRERTTALQWLGLSVALMGMLAYSHVKKKQMAVDGLASLGYEALTDSEDLDDIENNGIEAPSMSPMPKSEPVELVFDDLEDLTAGSPACAALPLPSGQRVADLPEAECVGRTQVDVAETGAEDRELEDNEPEDEDSEDKDPSPGRLACTVPASSCSQPAGAVLRPLVLESTCAEVAAAGADATEENMASGVGEALNGAGIVAVNDSTSTVARDESPMDRSGSEVEGAAAAVVDTDQNGEQAGAGGDMTSPGEDRTGDAVEGISDHSGGSWVIEDGAASPVEPGEAAGEDVGTAN